MDSQFTAEQVAHSMQADAAQVEIWHRWLASHSKGAEMQEPLNCHVGRRYETPLTTAKGHQTMHEQLAAREPERQRAAIDTVKALRADVRAD